MLKYYYKYLNSLKLNIKYETKNFLFFSEENLIFYIKDTKYFYFFSYLFLIHKHRKNNHFLEFFLFRNILNVERLCIYCSKQQGHFLQKMY